MILADALIEALHALKVRYVFGVSGANIEHVHDAIHRRGRGRLVSILAKSEDGAAFMADAHARVRRTLAVCCSTSGGGMMNLTAGIAEAYNSSVPVLALVGQPPPSLEGRGAFQDSSGIGRTVNAEQLFASMSKFTKKVTDAGSFWSVLEDAVVAALGGRPGPSVLLLPRSMYTSEVGELPPSFVANVKSRTLPTSPSEAEVRAILDELRMARRPVLVLGQGCARTREPGALFDFADAIDIPVATTMAARGEFPNDHRNYLGVLGVAGHPSAHVFIRDKCDVLLLAGASLNTMTRAPFARDPVDLPEKHLIAVSQDLGELRRITETKVTPRRSSDKPPRPSEKPPGRSWWPNAVTSLALGVEADIGATFSELYRAWKETPFKVRPLGAYEPLVFTPIVVSSQSRPSLTPPSHELSVVLDPPSAESVDASGTLSQSVALECLAPHLPTQGTILYDAGNCAAAALHLLPVPHGVSTVIALGMGGMGYAIAGAIGAQLGLPAGSRTMVLTGDGSFLMLGLEVHTAVDLGLPILFVVFNNNKHGMCATRQTIFFESRFEAVSYSPVDIALLARGLGSKDRLWVGKARTRDELEAALADFAQNPLRPGVLELCLDVEEVPPFTPFLPKEPATSPSLRPPPRSSQGDFGLGFPRPPRWEDDE